MIAIAQWNASQAELYPNSLSLNQAPSLEEVLISKYKNDTNDMTNRDTAINYLSQISDRPTAEYIIDRITSIEVLSLIQQFEKFKRELKKYYPKGLSKDEFVQYIKLKQNDYLNPENTNEAPWETEINELSTYPINENNDDFRDDFGYTPTPVKNPKLKKAKVEKATTKKIEDYFEQFNPLYQKEQQANPMYEKAETFPYDYPDELLISDNQDAMIYAEKQINTIKKKHLLKSNQLLQKTKYR